MDLIIVEDKLNEILVYLDPVKNVNGTSFKPTFKKGSQLELIAFLKEKKQDKPYPLIWMRVPYIEKHYKKHVELTDVDFIFAVETNSSMYVEERIEITYKKQLLPLVDNFLKLLKVANTVNWDRRFNLVKYPNYSGDDDTGLESETGDIWDAVKLTLSFKLNNVCLRKIKI